MVNIVFLYMGNKAHTKKQSSHTPLYIGGGEKLQPQPQLPSALPDCGIMLPIYNNIRLQ